MNVIEQIGKNKRRVENSRVGQLHHAPGVYSKKVIVQTIDYTFSHYRFLTSLNCAMKNGNAKKQLEALLQAGRARGLYKELHVWARIMAALNFCNLRRPDLFLRMHRTEKKIIQNCFLILQMIYFVCRKTLPAKTHLQTIFSLYFIIQSYYAKLFFFTPEFYR